MDKPIKLLTISDHPLVSSGVGTQTRYIIEGLLKTGRYEIRSLGGAMKHGDYRPQKVQEFGDKWVIYPIDGYGNDTTIRQLLDVEQCDAVWFMTDPRFYIWLYNMSDEIRDRGVPLLYYHVWDNYPVPKFNQGFYKSCDYIGCISKLTHDIICQLGMEANSSYIPHAVDPEVFKPFSEEDIKKQKKQSLGANADKFVIFYNSRNARRKMTSDIVKSFKMFLDKVGQDKAFLLMHTDPHDQEGANLIDVAEMLGLTNDQLAFSNERVNPEQMASFYNIADVTINISNNEGFGLSCLESLSCGTLAIVNETGGLQDQIRDNDGTVFGVSIKPATKSLTGSQQIPYIFDDRCSDEDVLDAMLKLYNMTAQERRELGLKAHEWTKKQFSLENMINAWDTIITSYVKHFKEFGYPDRIRFDKI